MAETVQYGEFTYENPMRAPHIEKVVVNIGVGEAGDKLIKAEKVIEAITGKKSSRTLAKSNNREWAVRVGMPVGVRVTLRGEDADEFLKRALWVREFKVPEYGFDDYGNLNFGIPDHTEFQGQRYDPEIGIFGMDIAIVLERPGMRVRRRRLTPRKIPDSHRLARKEAMEFMKAKFNVEVL
jgi:large subunit ribosomal protein L5